MTASESTLQQPRVWRYLLAFLILTPIWIVALELWIKPKALEGPRPILPRLGYYLLPTSTLLLGIFAISASVANAQEAKTQAQQKAQQVEAERQKKETEAQAKSVQERKQFTLEVLGLGLAVDKFRQTWVLEGVEKLPPEKTILPEDPKAYPWSSSEKDLLTDQRSGNSLEHALSWFIRDWPIPAFLAGPAMHRSNKPTSLSAPYVVGFHAPRQETENRWVNCLEGALQSGGLHKTTLVAVETLYEDSPDEVFDHAFAFMDAHPEVPAVLVFVRDGSYDRDANSKEGTPYITSDGYRQPGEMTESFTALLLARRDRVEAMRGHATSDDQHSDSLTPFWAKHKATGGFHPSEFMSKPWTQEQFKQFDQLPVLGRLHRPQAVPFTKDGKPLSDHAKGEAFALGWRAALETLPEGAKPSRMIYDCGPGKAARISSLANTLNTVDSHLDIHKPGESLDLTKRLGDTGADSFFVGTALGVIASHRHNGVTAVVSFRNPESATIIMVTPPTAEERQKQHPGGKDPLNLPLAP
jgi:protein-tyrosine-phosphatase